MPKCSLRNIQGTKYQKIKIYSKLLSQFLCVHGPSLVSFYCSMTCIWFAFKSPLRGKGTRPVRIVCSHLRARYIIAGTGSL